ncbi:MAG TPA: glycosyltransferase family 39 protein [Chloroflexota bacterium]|nr:glycosyltransferase family 39 protein [Chloroflexota bacterium]
MSAAERRALTRLLLLVLSVYLLSMAGRMTSGDGETVYQTTRALVTRRQLSVSRRPETAIGRSGRAYGKYGLGQSIVQAPFLVAGELVGSAFGAGDDRPARFAVGAANSVVSTALVGLFWLTARRLGASQRDASIGSLALAFCTLVWPYARSDFSEPLQSLLLLLVFFATLRWRAAPSLGWAVAIGAAAGAAILTKAASAVVLAPLGLYVLFASRQHRSLGMPRLARHAVAAALPLLASLAFQAALNLYRFGRVTEFGYGSEPAEGFTTPLLRGVGYLLLSSGKGLFLFTPPVLLALALLVPLARRLPAEAATIAGVFLAELLYFARWWAWHGDWAWGPRYMVPTVPFLMLTWPLAGDMWRRTAWLRAFGTALAGAGFCVSILGVVVDYGAYYSVVGSQLGKGVDVQEARLVPEFSPLLGHAWLLRAAWHDTIARWRDPAHDARDNPARDAYPWAARYPDLVPEAPERAYGFDLWFVALNGRTRFAEYWSWLAAAWLALAAARLAQPRVVLAAAWPR